MKKLYIIKAGTTFASALERLGDFEDWVQRALGELGVPVEVIDVVAGEPLPAPLECGGVIVTGSHAMVTDNLAWSLATELWIPKLLDSRVPFLGICYGHQLLGRAMGGVVGYHPLGREIGTVELSLTSAVAGDLLFKGIPDHFLAHTVHAQSVLQLPPGALSLAWSAHDQHHAYRIGQSAWGVQFHPEYTAAVMQLYILAQSETLKREGREVDGLLLKVSETPFASKVLSNFAALVRQYITL